MLGGQSTWTEIGARAMRNWISLSGWSLGMIQCSMMVLSEDALFYKSVCHYDRTKTRKNRY